MAVEHLLCADLVPGVRCFRSMRFRDGTWTETLHEHVPSHRISRAAAHEALRSIAARVEEWPANFILSSYLNSRSGTPERYPGFTSTVSYPEGGVVRVTVTARNTWASCDRVVEPAAFRPTKS